MYTHGTRIDIWVGKSGSRWRWAAPRHNRYACSSLEIWLCAIFMLIQCAAKLSSWALIPSTHPDWMLMSGFRPQLSRYDDNIVLILSITAYVLNGYIQVPDMVPAGECRITSVVVYSACRSWCPYATQFNTLWYWSHDLTRGRPQYSPSAS